MSTYLLETCRGFK